MDGKQTLLREANTTVKISKSGPKIMMFFILNEWNLIFHLNKHHFFLKLVRAFIWAKVLLCIFITIKIWVKRLWWNYDDLQIYIFMYSSRFHSYRKYINLENVVLPVFVILQSKGFVPMYYRCWKRGPEKYKYFSLDIFIIIWNVQSFQTNERFKFFAIKCLVDWFRFF